MNSKAPPDLARKITLQRLAMLWEAIWHKIQKPLLVIGIAIAIFASNSIDDLPKWFQLSMIVILAAALIYSMKELLALRQTNTLAAMRRMEQHSDISHRSLSSHDDAITAENQSADSVALWQEYHLRKLQALDTVFISPPKSSWREFDPLALRVPVALLALAALALGSGDVVSNIRNAANPNAAAFIRPLTIDAWLKPPSYTAKPPLLLTSAAMREKLHGNADILTPENSTLTVHVQGANNPHLAVFDSTSTEIKSITSKTAMTDSGFTADLNIDRPLIIKLMDGSAELATWPFTPIPDEPPKIKFAEDPKADANGNLAVKWQASDDYGVKGISSEISLADEQENGMGFENNGVFLYDPPIAKIIMRSPGAKTEAGESKLDLTAHAWAGLYVTMTLTATDAAGHSTVTEPKRFKLPERAFFRPLARALIEQRKKLIMKPDDAPDVATVLDALLAYPYAIADHSGLILNLASIKAQLANEQSNDDVAATAQSMWPIAVAIEDGEMADARAQLHDLKKQLEQALRDGAPPERIAELMDKMRKTMDKLLEQMQKDAQKRLAEGSLKPSPNGKSINKDDLQKMLDDIEKMSKSGSKDAAQDLLSQLDQLLQNLQPSADPSGQSADPQLQGQMNALSDLMKRQQKLMDDTQRMKPDEGSQDLSGQQGELSDQLGKLNQQLGENGQNEFGSAGKNMKSAQGDLGKGSKGEALREQGQAMDQLQKGARKLSKKLSDSAQGKSGSQGKEGDQSGNSDDPLGRPRATHDPGTGPDKNIVPTEQTMRRAREILRQLRDRVGEPNLSETEKAYLDRLLKGLY